MLRLREILRRGNATTLSTVAAASAKDAFEVNDEQPHEPPPAPVGPTPRPCLDTDETQVLEPEFEVAAPLPSESPVSFKPFPELEPGYVTRREQFQLRDDLANANGQAEDDDVAVDVEPKAKGKKKSSRKGKAMTSADAEQACKKPTKSKRTKQAKGDGTNEALVAFDEDEGESDHWFGEEVNEVLPAKPRASKKRKVIGEGVASASSMPSASSKTCASRAKPKGKANRRDKAKIKIYPVEDLENLAADRSAEGKKKKKVKLPILEYQEPLVEPDQVQQALTDLFESCWAGNCMQIHQFPPKAPCRGSYYWTKGHVGLKVDVVTVKGGCKDRKQLHYFSNPTPAGCMCSRAWLCQQMDFWLPLQPTPTSALV